MIKKIKESLNKIIYPNKYSSDAYVEYLRRNGAEIGNNTTFIYPKNTVVDEQKLEFIKIGDDCCITSGVVILAHDWSYSVLARVYNDAPGKQRVTNIGNNVFIGMNSIILMGANIGDNVIIGAGSVVSGRIDSNSVYAGNPARKICTLDDHYKKLSNDYINSAKVFVNRFREKHGRLPEISEMELYTTLFVDKNKENMDKYFRNSYIKFAIKEMPKKFNSVNELINNI